MDALARVQARQLGRARQQKRHLPPGVRRGFQKLWVAQAELTFSMPKSEAAALVGAIKKAGSQAPRGAIANLVPDAEAVFSKSGEAMKMVAAGKDVEPTVIATVQAGLR